MVWTDLLYVLHILPEGTKMLQYEADIYLKQIWSIWFQCIVNENTKRRRTDRFKRDDMYRLLSDWSKSP